MRRIRIEEPHHRAWIRWIRVCEKASEALAATVAAGGAITFREKIHRPKAIRRHYFFSKEAPFFGKCAYCESPLELVDGDVDHFRPKRNVCAPDGKPIEVEGEDPPHRGYFWLAYSWRNLLPSCKTCNQIYKRAQFPVEGRRATSADELGEERPLLLDPVSIDPAADPVHHLEVDQTGQIAGKSLRGYTSIRVLGLDRDGLVKERRRAYLEVEALFARATRGEAQAWKDLEEIVEGRRPFYLVQKKAITRLAERAES